MLGKIFLPWVTSALRSSWAVDLVLLVLGDGDLNLRWKGEQSFKHQEKLKSHLLLKELFILVKVSDKTGQLTRPSPSCRSTVSVLVFSAMQHLDTRQQGSIFLNPSWNWDHFLVTTVSSVPSLHFYSCRCRWRGSTGWRAWQTGRGRLSCRGGRAAIEWQCEWSTWQI